MSGASAEDTALEAESEAFVFLGRQYLLVELASPVEPVLRKLTGAERAVLDALLTGIKMDAIAMQRGTSVRTVQSQVSTLYRKLGVSCRAGLLRQVRAAR